jgi:ankyrin
MAVRRGFTDSVQALMNYDNLFLDMPTRAGITALHLAAKHGDLPIVQLLLGRGAGLSARTHDGYTPFLLAALNRQKAVVAYFLSIPDFDPNEHSDDGTTALMIAVNNNSSNLVELLLDCPRVDPNAPGFIGPLFLALRLDRRSLIQKLIHHPRVRFSEKSDTGLTFLHMAIKEGNEEVIERILSSRQIDVNAEDANGATPLHRACAIGSLRIVELLLADPEIDVNCLRSDEFSPLTIATMPAIVCRLLDRDELLVNRIEHGGMAPIHVFASDNNVVCLKRLCTRPDLDVNLKDERGMTAVVIGVLRNLPDIVRVIAQRDDMDRDVVADALAAAKANGFEGCAELLGGREPPKQQPGTWLAKQGKGPRGS